MNHPLPRALSSPLRAALDSSPVVVVSGARQSGKSTLAIMEGGQRDYVTFDDLEARAQAREAPGALLTSAPRLTLDEVQAVPELLLQIKRLVDRGRRPGQFLLTGSANILLMKRVSESLAGRAVYLELWPMTQSELRGAGSPGSWSLFFDNPRNSWLEQLETNESPQQDWRAAARRGGYPTPAHHLRSVQERNLWFRGYAQTYLERDLQELSAVSSLVDFRRFMQAASLRLGQVLNQSHLARDAGLSQPTAHRYINLLEVSHQFIRIPAYSVSRTKRLVKSPKLFASDPGLALHLSGESEPRGAHLENLIAQDLFVWRSILLEHPPQILYWRTTTGAEVDFVVEHLGRLLPIEIKAGAKPRLEDTRHLHLFLDEYRDKADAALLLHTGSSLRWLTDRVLAVPWWKVL